MIKYIILSLLLGLSMNVNGQKRNQKGGKIEFKGSITGFVIDSINMEIVEFATIELLDSTGSKLLDGVLSNERGKFKFGEVNTGKYTLKVSFLGYRDKLLKNISLSLRKPDKALGKIKLSPTSFKLDEVEITDARSIIENRVDKLVYNVAKDYTLIGGDATDVLRKVPMLTVDLDGNVSLRGSQQVRILLNGKPSGLFADDVADALKMFPADEIETVEVITAPGAKYDGEGAAGIINIVTIKKRIEGFSTKASTFISNRSNSLNLNLSTSKGRFGFNVKAGARGRLPIEGDNYLFREDYIGDELRVLDQTGKSDDGYLGFRGSASAYYDINAFNSFNTTFSLRGRNRTSDREISGSFSDPINNTFYDYGRENHTQSFRSGYNWTTDYTKKFAGEKDRELSFAFQLDGNSSNNKNEAIFSDQNHDENNKNISINKEYTLQVDYVHPILKSWKVEVGAKSIFRDLNSDYQLVLTDKQTGLDSIDDRNTDIFNYDQLVYAAYASSTLKLPGEIGIITGLRYENTGISGSFNSNRFVKFNNNYDNWFPHFAIQKRFKDFSSLKFSYNKRIQRPGLREINPFVNDDDPRNISYGNPELDPERVQQLELNYSKFINGSMVSSSLYYKFTDQLIERYLLVDSSDVSKMTYFNIGEKKSYGINLFGSSTFFKILDIRANLDLFTYAAEGVKEGLIMNNNAVQYNAFFSSTISLPKDWKISIWGHFSSPRYTIQGKQSSFWMYSFGFQKELFNKMASIGIRIIDPFNESVEFYSITEGENFYQKSARIIPFRTVGVSFSYRYGKLKFKERKSKISNDDILRGGDGGEEN